MYRIFLLFILIGMVTSGYGQGYLGKNRKHVIRLLEKYLEKNHLGSAIQQTDTTVVLALRVSNVKPADFIFHFNSRNKCIIEETIACDTCARKYFYQALNNRIYKWVMVNEHTYVSSFFWHLLMEYDNKEGQVVFRISRTDWSRAQYNRFLRNH